MFDQFFKNVPQFDSALNSSKEFNRLAVNTAEKLAAFQLERARSYTDFGFEQLRAAFSVQNGKDLQDYLASRNQAVQALGKQLQDDAKALGELGSSFSNEAQKLVRDQASGVQGKKAA